MANQQNGSNPSAVVVIGIPVPTYMYIIFLLPLLGKNNVGTGIHNNNDFTTTLSSYLLH